MKYFKKHVILFIFSTISLFITFYVVGYLYIYYTSDQYYIEDKFAKSIHMDYMYSNSKYDYILIGSSRTQFHISTNILRDNNISAYNYGRPGVTLRDMPYLVKKALSNKPKYIVLSIPINDLYRTLRQPAFPTTFDYYFINKAAGTSFEFNSINDGVYSEIKLKDIFSQIKKRKSIQDIKKRLSDLNIDNATIDCNITNFRGFLKKRTVLMCNNGDGIVIGKVTNDKYHLRKLSNSKISKEKIKLLNSLIGYIEGNNVVPILIFETFQYNSTFQYNINYLKQLIKTNKIIDNTNFNQGNIDLWADKAHHNLEGRKLYSLKLAKQLNDLEQIHYSLD